MKNRETSDVTNPAGDDLLVEALLTLREQVSLQSGDSSRFSDPRFIEWLAREARAQVEDGIGNTAWPEDQVASVAQSLLAHVAASKCKLRRISRWPDPLAAEVSGSASAVLEDARRAGAAPCLDVRVAAGIGRELWDEECESWISIPPDTPPGNYVGLKVAGDSMAPLLHPEDIMLVRLGPSVTPGNVVIARLDEDTFVVKRVGRVTGASIELLSVNPAYPSLHVSRAEKRIIGTVVLNWCGHEKSNQGA